MKYRVRMAPSPTGEYHIGGMRTFLYNYALARQSGGAMVLRIEDTDKNREVEGATERLLDVIKEYGLGWDEGPDIGGPHAPYVQSARLQIYREHVNKLIDSGNAYYCFCSEERLNQLREEQKSRGEITRYDKHCSHIPKEEAETRVAAGDSYVVRLNVPDNEMVEWNDLIIGTVAINSNEIDHQVLLKSDGYPTYHLAVVVDDYLMEINTVLRGNEWIPSTPKQLLLYRAFGWNEPEFGHLPNLKEEGSTKKLSKRFGDVHAIKFLEKGYLAPALVNFLMFLGWNPGTDKEIYTLKEFINDFSLDKVSKTDLVSFDRAKLLWINGVYIRNMTSYDLWAELEKWSDKFGIELLGSDADTSYKLQVLSIIQERLKTLDEYNSLVHYFYTDPAVDPELLSKFGKDKTFDILSIFTRELENVDGTNWQVDQLDELCHKVQSQNGFTPKEAFMTLRVALTGETATPPIFDTMALLGKDTVVSRLKKASTH